MLGKPLYKLTANRPCRLIGSNGKRYMERYYLGNVLGLTFYLHRFVSSDGDRALHDHPWRFSMGICLTGGYLERRLRWFNPKNGFDCAEKKVRPGRFNLIRATTFHQILSTQPETWTLFFHSPKFKGWGFMHRIEEIDSQGVTRIVPHYEADSDGNSHKKWWLDAPTGKKSDRANFIGKGSRA